LLSQLTGGCSAQPERTHEEDDECCLGGPAFHLFFLLYMGKKRIHAGIAASTSESPATIVMFTHDSMPHYPDTTLRRPRNPRSERVVRLGTNSPTHTLFDGKEGNKNYKHLGTELLDSVNLEDAAKHRKRGAMATGAHVVSDGAAWSLSEVARHHSSSLKICSSQVLLCLATAGSNWGASSASRPTDTYRTLMFDFALKSTRTPVKISE
jgi:hypothetical protein